MKFGICSNSIYQSACDNLTSDRSYALFMAKLEADQYYKCLLPFSTHFYLKSYIKRAVIHAMIHSGMDTARVLKHKSYLGFTDPQETGSKLLRCQNLESRTDSHCLIFGTLPQTWGICPSLWTHSRKSQRPHRQASSHGASKHLRCDMSESIADLYLKVINI